LRELKLDEIELEIGRPRTEAYIVYVFLMLRGFNGGCKDQNARLLLEESMTLKLWLEHLGLELPPASTLSDNLNAVSNQTRRLIHDVQLRYILQGGLDDFQKCFIDSTAVEANTERPTDSTILVRLIARVCVTGGNLHRLDLPDMNQIGLLERGDAFDVVFRLLANQLRNSHSCEVPTSRVFERSPLWQPKIQGTSSYACSAT
jgi:hypothetical protein